MRREKTGERQLELKRMVEHQEDVQRVVHQLIVEKRWRRGCRCRRRVRRRVGRHRVQEEVPSLSAQGSSVGPRLTSGTDRRQDGLELRGYANCCDTPGSGGNGTRGEARK